MIIDLGNGFSIEILKKAKLKSKVLGLLYEEVPQLVKWQDIVDFVEYLNAYQRNHLSMTKRYALDLKLEIELYKREGEVLLAIYVEERWVYLDKVSASQLSHKINKVLNSCDLFVS